MTSRPINVTEPFLPPLEEYVEYLKGIWERNYLTNQGPLVKELEHKLQAYHGLEMPVHCVANGALGLQIALKALGVKGEVITTPFSYVATTSCPLWEGCTVTFADIESEYLTLDPKAVEAAIGPKTEAILATHVFGNPCDVEALERIAKKHNLAVIYDAAHAFGVTYKGKSILEWGDASMVSMHATKLFHTVEGGFMVARDPAVSAKIEWMRRFGHNGPAKFHGVGTNAKLTEMHAAMGLANLKHLPEILRKRSEVAKAYDEEFLETHAIYRAFKIRPGTQWNSSYYPVLLETEQMLLQLMDALALNQIFVRRYFYPLLDVVTGPAVDISVARSIGKRILALPMSTTVDGHAVGRLIKAALKSIKG